MASVRNDIPKLSLIHPNHLGLETVRLPSPPSIRRRNRYSFDRYSSTNISTHILRLPNISSWSYTNVNELWKGVDQIIHKQTVNTQLQRNR
jgi:hypothetical protein